MAQEKILNILNVNPNRYFSAKEIIKIYKTTGSSNVYKALNRLSHFGLIERKTDNKLNIFVYRAKR